MTPHYQHTQIGTLILAVLGGFSLMMFVLLLAALREAAPIPGASR